MIKLGHTDVVRNDSLLDPREPKPRKSSRNTQQEFGCPSTESSNKKFISSRVESQKSSNTTAVEETLSVGDKSASERGTGDNDHVPFEREKPKNRSFLGKIKSIFNNN